MPRFNDGRGGELMLILTRKCDQKIVIGKTDAAQRDCVITVISIRGGKIKLGIDADPRTRVRRAELLIESLLTKQLSDS